MHRSCLILALLAFGFMPTAETAKGAAPAEAPSKLAQPRQTVQTKLELADLTGARHRPLDVRGNKAAVLIFVLHDCPISNKYAPEIQRLADAFAAKKVPFYLVHVDPQLSLAEAKKHAQDYGYRLPVIIDRRHALVKQLKAATAPEAFVVGANQKVLYRGRIDDRYAGLGKPRQQVQRQDLRLALLAVIEGKPVEVAETKAIGCYIPELEE